MPLVFVHGVATRQTPDYLARVHQRDTLFKKFVLPKGSADPFDPDWGSNAVKLSPALPWLPKPGTAEAWAVGGGVGSDSGIARIASKKPEVALDLAFQAGLAERAQAAADTGRPEDALTDDDIAAFEAAIGYLEQDPKKIDKDAFDEKSSDTDFLNDLATELDPHLPGKKSGAEAMSIAGDALGWLGDGLKKLVDPIANVSSDAVLRLVRRPLSEQVALFLGDIFVYLRWREADGAKGTANRIFAPIVQDLVAAAKLRTADDPLIVVCHSLGAVVLYDLLTDKTTLAKIAGDIGSNLIVDAWVTVGAQPAVFADMGLYAPTPAAGAKYPKPAPVKRWFNVYDYTDVLSFNCSSLFEGVEDFEFDNVSSLFSAHGAYFTRPGFYARLRSRLKASAQP